MLIFPFSNRLSSDTAFSLARLLNIFGYVLQSEVEETLKRIQSHKGVQGVIVINSEGKPFS